MKSLLLALAASAALALPAQAEDVTVAVTAIVEHPALDATRDGVKDALEAAGYKEGEGLTFVYQSAQGNPATAAQIARQFIGEAPDVIVPISTPSAQAVVSATQDIPVVFTAVSDPLGAQLVKDMQKPGGNVTGLSDMSPVAAHVDLIKEILPQVKTIGYLYNSGEANSVSLLAALKAAAEPAGIAVVESAATKTAEVQGAARALVGRVDAVYVPTDNTIISALEAAVAVTQEAKLPLFTADTDSVSRGSIAALGFNYYDVGKQTGEVVVRILKGEKPGDIAVEIAEGTDLVVNKAAAQKIGLELPESVVSRATKVID
ncbi:MAG: ABC transporter substrate-binding protein [Pseudomonadota bacterium]|nr:ABC transporter substrate-binding protein [Pseudomonadota bacterium]